MSKETLKNMYTIVFVATIVQVLLAITWVIMASEAASGNPCGWLAKNFSEEMVYIAAGLYFVPCLWCLFMPQYDEMYYKERCEERHAYYKRHNSLDGFVFLGDSFKELAKPIVYGYISASVLFVLGSIIAMVRFL